MAFQESVGGAELGQYLVFAHRLSTALPRALPDRRGGRRLQGAPRALRRVPPLPIRPANSPSRGPNPSRSARRPRGVLMKILLKLFAAAAALGMAPAAASAQPGAPAPGAAPAPAVPAQRPIDAVSANSQAAPAGPADVSANGMQAGAEPSNAQIAAASIGARSTPTPGIGQPDGGIHLQQQFTPIGKEAARFHNIILVPLIFV